jgi:hypothetical protein
LCNAKYHIDFETNPEVAVVLVAQDATGQSASAIIIVHVSDANDAPCDDTGAPPGQCPRICAEIAETAGNGAVYTWTRCPADPYKCTLSVESGSKDAACEPTSFSASEEKFRAGTIDHIGNEILNWLDFDEQSFPNLADADAHYEILASSNGSKFCSVSANDGEQDFTLSFQIDSTDPLDFETSPLLLVDLKAFDTEGSTGDYGIGQVWIMVRNMNEQPQLVIDGNPYVVEIDVLDHLTTEDRCKRVNDHLSNAYLPYFWNQDVCEQSNEYACATVVVEDPDGDKLSFLIAKVEAYPHGESPVPVDYTDLDLFRLSENCQNSQLSDKCTVMRSDDPSTREYFDYERFAFFKV